MNKDHEREYQRAERLNIGRTAFRRLVAKGALLPDALTLSGRPLWSTDVLAVVRDQQIIEPYRLEKIPIDSQLLSFHEMKKPSTYLLTDRYSLTRAVRDTLDSGSPSLNFEAEPHIRNKERIRPTGDYGRRRSALGCLYSLFGVWPG
jgi:hypothetical protein